MPQRLSDMVFDEVSFVTRGANQPALVALFKADVDKAGRPSMVSCPKSGCDGKFPMGTKKCPTCDSTISYTSKAMPAAFAPPGGNNGQVGSAGPPVAPRPGATPVQEGAMAADGHKHKRASFNTSGANGNGNPMANGAYCEGCGAPIAGSQDPDPGDDSQNLTKRWVEKIKSIFKADTLTQEQQAALDELEDAVTNHQIPARTLNEPDNTGGKTQVGDNNQTPARPSDEAIAKLDDGVKAWLAHVEKADTDKDAEIETLKEKVTTLEEQVEVGKSDDPIAAAIAKADAATRPILESLRKSAEEAGNLAKAEQERRVESEFISKYEPIAKGLSTTGAQLGPIMKRAASVLSKEDFEEVERLFKSAAEVARSSNVMRIQGSTGGAPSTGSTAMSKLDAKAGELRKNDNSLTPETARAKALAEDPALYADYLRERKDLAAASQS